MKIHGDDVFAEAPPAEAAARAPGVGWRRRVTPRFKGFLRGQLTNGCRMLLPIEAVTHAECELQLHEWRWVEVVIRGNRHRDDRVIYARGPRPERGCGQQHRQRETMLETELAT